MNVGFHPAAEREFVEALQLYLRHQQRVAAKFDRAVFEIVDSMKTRSDMGWPYIRGTRQARVSGFPYGIIFLTHQDFTLIVAVAHSSRKPGYWVERIPSGFVPGTSSE